MEEGQSNESVAPSAAPVATFRVIKLFDEPISIPNWIPVVLLLFVAVGLAFWRLRRRSKP
jgi:hypothetical protein